MGNHMPADRPVCTWVPVIDSQGRTRMEARWTTASPLARTTAA